MTSFELQVIVFLKTRVLFCFVFPYFWQPRLDHFLLPPSLQKQDGGCWSPELGYPSVKMTQMKSRIGPTKPSLSFNNLNLSFKLFKFTSLVMEVWVSRGLRFSVSLYLPLISTLLEHELDPESVKLDIAGSMDHIFKLFLHFFPQKEYMFTANHLETTNNQTEGKYLKPFNCCFI